MKTQLIHGRIKEREQDNQRLSAKLHQGGRERKNGIGIAGVEITE